MIYIRIGAHIVCDFIAINATYIRFCRISD